MNSKDLLKLSLLGMCIGLLLSIMNSTLQIFIDLKDSL